MPTLGDAYVQIIPSAKNISGMIKNAMGNGAEQEGANQGKLFSGKFATTVKTAIAALGIGKIIKDSIAQGGELEQSIGGIETLFGAKGAQSVNEYAQIVGKTVGEVKGEYYDLMRGQKIALNNASDAWKTTGLSANEYMQNISGFAAALNSSLGGDTVASAKAANMAMIDMADNSNKMGTSMEAIQNAYQGFAKQNYTMLDNLKLGYGGTKTEMERLLKDAKAVSGVEYNIDNLSDVYEAIHVIQGEIGITGTTAREAEHTLQGSASAMKAAWTDLLGNMATGGDVEQSMQNLVQSVSTYLFGNLVPMIGRIGASLPKALGQAITTGLPLLMSNGMQLIESLKSGVISKIPDFLNQGLPMLLSFTSNLRSNFSTLVDAGIDLIMNLLDGLIDGLPAIISYVPQIVTNIASLINDNAPKVLLAGIKMIKNLALGIWNNRNLILSNMGNIFQAVVSVISAINWIQLGSKVIQLIQNGIKALFNALPNIMKTIGNNAKSFFQNIPWSALGSTVINLIKNGISALFSAIPTILKSIGSSALDFFRSVNWSGVGSTVINLISSGISGLFSAIPNTLRSIGSSALSAFSSINWSSMGSSIISGIVSGISSAGGAIRSTLMGLAQNAWSAAKNFFKIGSPSRLMRDTIGRYIPEGMAVGIENGSESVFDAMDKISKGVAGYEMRSSAVIGAAGSAAYGEQMPLNGTSGFSQSITINSPRELNPSEVARQTRNSTRKMVLAMRGV